MKFLHCMKKIIILGNGPSLNEVDITNNSEYAFCTVNYSVLNDIFFKIRPQYHTLADPAFFRDDNANIKSFYSVLETKIDWPMTLFIPQSAKNFVYDKIKNNKKINIMGYSPYNWEPKSNIYQNLKFFLYKKNMILPILANVVIAATACAINVGYKTIELYGVEHSWTKSMFVNNDNVLCLSDTHFYNPKESAKPWYRIPGSKETFTMAEILSALSLTFKSHEELQKYSQYLGNVKIINKTPNSFIDAYQRG